MVIFAPATPARANALIDVWDAEALRHASKDSEIATETVLETEMVGFIDLSLIERKPFDVTRKAAKSREAARAARGIGVKPVARMDAVSLDATTDADIDRSAAAMLRAWRAERDAG